MENGEGRSNLSYIYTKKEYHLERKLKMYMCVHMIENPREIIFRKIMFEH